MTIEKPLKIDRYNQERVLNYWEKLIKNAEQMARWMSLYEAVNMIADKAKEKKIDFENVDLSPIKIKEYMDATSDIYYRKYLQNEFGIDIFYSDREE